MTAFWVWPTITRTDVWLCIGLTALVFLAIKACRVKFPEPGVIQGYATISNTKGGIILILLFLWLFTLVLTVTFCVWVIVRGVDPQHAVVITLLGVLQGTAFGNVNGAFFKTMTGEDPKLPPPPSPPVQPPTPSQPQGKTWPIAGDK